MRDLHELTAKGGLEQLIAFAAVAEAGSFAGAAKALQRDPSVLSRHVSALEKRLGVRLLSRTTRSVVLTEAGARFSTRVQNLLEELASASLEASDYAEHPQGRIKVSLPVTFGRRWVAPLFSSFLENNPRIQIDARFDDRIIDIVGDGFDLAIRVSASLLDDSSLVIRKLASYRNLVVASPRFLELNGAPKEPTELPSFKCLGFTGFASWPDWTLVRGNDMATVRPGYVLTSDNSEALLLAALEGAGITFLPEWLVGPELRAGRFVEALTGWTGKEKGGVYAILPPGRLVPAKTRVFLDAIAACIKAEWET